MDDAKPLKVLIVGAGLGGLTAAIALQQNGHHVEIYEKSQMAREVGAAVVLNANAICILQRLGLCPETFGGTEAHPEMFFVDGVTLARQSSLNGSMMEKTFFVHRVDLHNELRRVATATIASEASSHLHRGVAVESIDCHAASITLADGTTVSGDVVIAADGVHSNARKCVVGDVYREKPTGLSCFRFLLPVATLKDESATANLLPPSSSITDISSNGRRIVMYPCSYGRVMNIAAFVSREEAGWTGQGWDRENKKEKLLSAFRDFAPHVRHLLDMTREEDITTWDILDMNVLPIWVRGHVALIGDAAHPFTPFLGQGAAQAMEDAASLAVMLPLGISPADVTDRLILFEKSRKARVDRIQNYSRERVGLAKASGQAPPTGHVVSHWIRYCVSHDEWENSHAILQSHLRKL